MIVLPMAGLSSRFFNAGYKVPKYMLDLHGSPIFDHALGTFFGLFGQERFLIICRDIYDTPNFVRTRCRVMGLNDDAIELVTLPGETAGQAETVAQGLRAANLTGADPITIFNVDTFRPGFAYPTDFDHHSVDGYLEVFYGEGDHWSFARAAAPNSNCVVEVSEKVRISDLCSDGLYFFRSAGYFCTLYAEIENKHPASLQGGEYYVAPLYNVAIRRGADIRYSLVPPRAIRFCGTPEEYDEMRARAPFGPTEV